MDMDFVEFWRNFFLKPGEGRKSVDDITSWMRQGFAGFDQMNAFFQNSCALDQVTRGSLDFFQAWKKTREDFQKSISAYLAMLGGVPRAEHLDLIRKFEELKEQADSQKETIKNLRTLLAEEKKVEHKELTGQVQDLIEQQARQFQRIMESFKQEKAEPPGRPAPAAAEQAEALEAKKPTPESKAARRAAKKKK